MKPSVLARIASKLSDTSAIVSAVESQQAPRSVAQREYVAPEGKFEEPIGAIWTRLLRLERVGRADDFMLLSGDSLLATQMLARVSQLFGVQLPLTEIFTHTTLESFAQAVEAAVSSGEGMEQPRLSSVVRPAQLPLSYAQQRLWFLDQWEPGGHVYIVPVVFRVRGRLDVDALRRGLDAVVARHEGVRTTFDMDAGEAVQRVHAKVEVPLRFVDARGHAEAEPMAIVGEEMRRPFDLSRDVLLRAVVVRVADEEFLLGLAIHHIVADGWSLDILVRELSGFYSAFAEGRQAGMEPLPMQFADYAVWQRGYLAGVVLDEQVAYWRKQLEGAPAQLKLPTDRPRPANQSFRGALLPFRLPAELTGMVAEICRTEQVTPFIALLTVLQVLLRQYSGQNDISVGSPIANRTNIETEGLIGFFANTLVLRTVFPADPTFREMLAKTRETAFGAYGHQYMPLEKLVEILKPPRASYNPLFQVNFRVITTPPAALRLGSSVAERVVFDPGIARFDLALELLVSGERFEGFFEYSTDLFSAETVLRFQRDFEQALRTLAKAQDATLSSLGLGPAAGVGAERGMGIRKRAARAAGAVG